MVVRRELMSTGVVRERRFVLDLPRKIGVRPQGEPLSNVMARGEVPGLMSRDDELADASY